ncbi:MAG TPA: BTAD domain-containing putative transcriptional regulator [Gaiellaceae bacterium]|nr:BTAD domain-containing putative transcriptional regulator [Gaiellaceae bacterium]
MEFRILGPLEISDDGRALALGGGRQFALVALLLIHRNAVVPTDEIVEELWQGSPPATAPKAVRNTVSLLRKELGDRLVTRSPGYMLRVEPDELDSARLEQAVADGRPEALAGALALWRGPPLAQVAYYDFARAEIDRLDELHLAAIETRIDADLEEGHHAAVAPELEALTRAYPLRERFLEQLMLALYRSGRQADALDAYRHARRTLDAELGLEPSRHLQELERKILTQDPALDAPMPPARTPVALRRRGGLLIAVGAGAVLAGAVTAAVIVLTGGGTKSLAAIAPNSIGVIDPASNRLVAEIPVGANPTRLGLSGESLWTLNGSDATVSRIDTRRRTVVRTIPVPGPPLGVAADGTGAWVVYVGSGSNSDFRAARAAFVDGRFNDVKRTVLLNRVSEGSDSAAIGLGSVWVADPGFVTRLDPSGRVRALIPVPYTLDTAIAVGAGAVWATVGSGIVRIDPARNAITAAIPVAQATSGGPSPTAIAATDDAVWVANRFVGSREGKFGVSGKRGTVSRIDPVTNAVAATITVGHEPFSIAAGQDAVWVANRTDFTVSHIDAHTNHVTKTIRIGNRPQGIAVGDGGVWVSVG